MDTTEQTVSIDTDSICPKREGAMPFEKELSAYDANLIDLLPHEGKYVLIRGAEIGGIFDSYDQALQAGYDKYELDTFLVKQIHRAEPIHYFSRDLSPCRP